MKRDTIVFLMLLFLPYYAFCSDPTGSDVFEWDTKGPIEFLELLQPTENAPWCFIVNEGLPPCEDNRIQPCSFKACQYTINENHNNWVSVEDIPQLISLLDSEIACASVASIVSSYIGPGKSSVGHEAAFLIEGFRTGVYPPHLNSSRWKANKEDILKWWHNFNK